MKRTQPTQLFGALHALVLILPLMLTACGYGFGGGTQTVLPAEYHTLAVDEVDNPTTLSWIEPRIRSLLRDELTRRGGIKWVDDRDKADALIKITIERYYRPTDVEGANSETLRSSANFEFRATITSNIHGQQLWSSGTIAESWPFFQGQENEADKKVTELGIRKLADRMSQNY